MSRALTDDASWLPRWARRWLWTIGLLAVGLMLTVVVLHLVFPSQIKQQLALIRARGEPTNAEELGAYYTYPTVGEDATQLWLTAARQLKARSNWNAVRTLPFLGDGAEPPLPGQNWEQLDTATAFLAARAAEMQQLHTAAHMGGRARLPVDFAAGFGTLLNDTQTLRSDGARYLALEANVRAHTGDAHGVAESLRAGLILSRALETEPVLVSQMIRVGIHATAAKELLRLLPAVDFSDDDLAQLGATLESLEFHTAILHSMAGERAFGIMAFENPASSGLPPATQFAARLTGGSSKHRYLEIMREYIAASELPWRQLIDELQSIGQSVPGRLGHFDFIARMQLPSMGRAWTAFVRGEMLNRLAITAVALERYRRREGHPAPSLAALVPDYVAKLPDDPTSGKPFEYRATESGYVVFSESQMFDIPKDQQVDAETGANPMFLFRWPTKAGEGNDER